MATATRVKKKVGKKAVRRPANRIATAERTQVDGNGSDKPSSPVKAAAKKAVTLEPIQKRHYRFRVKGISPLISHQWSEKAKQQMRDKHAGRKTKTREVRDTEAEGRAAAYMTEDGQHGINALALKTSIFGAAHKDLGCEKTLVKKSLFICTTDKNKVLPIEFKSMEIREDPVGVGNNSTDLRYRPYYYDWSCEVTFELDATLLRLEDLLTLVNRAGFGVGIGEWRPEKGGEYGRFEIDKSYPVEEVDIG